MNGELIRIIILEEVFDFVSVSVSEFRPELHATQKL